MEFLETVEIMSKEKYNFNEIEDRELTFTREAVSYRWQELQYRRNLN